MLVAFARYSRDGSFGVLRLHKGFVVGVAAGSIAGAGLGGMLLGVVPETVIMPLLAAILVVSAVKLFRHRH